MAQHPFDPPCGFDIAATTIRDPETLGRITAWDYRLVAHPDETLFVHEAFYDADGVLLGLAMPPTRPCGDSPESIREELAWMQEALEEPVLRFAEFGALSGRFDRYGWRGDGGGLPTGPFLSRN
jgi:hypothetical protein